MTGFRDQNAIKTNGFAFFVLYWGRMTPHAGQKKKQQSLPRNNQSLTFTTNTYEKTYLNQYA